MRTIGAAESALDLMLQRVTDPARTTFGKHLYEHGTIVAAIGRSRAEIDGARLLVLSAAHQIDKVRAKGAKKDIGMAKYIVPSMALGVIDRAMQAYGAEGISQDTHLAKTWAGIRTLRFADVSSSSIISPWKNILTIVRKSTTYRGQMRFTSNRSARPSLSVQRSLLRRRRKPKRSKPNSLRGTKPSCKPFVRDTLCLVVLVPFAIFVSKLSMYDTAPPALTYWISCIL